MLCHFLCPLLLLASWGASAWAGELRSSPFCFKGCEYLLKRVPFNDTDPGIPAFTSSCQSRMGISSLYLCTKVYCMPESQTAGLKKYNQTCQNYANMTLPPLSIVDNYTEDEVASLRPLQPEEVDGRTIMGEVVIPSESLFELMYDTMTTAWYERDTHIRYGMAMYWFWAVVIGIGLGTHLISLITRLRLSEWTAVPSNEDIGDAELLTARHNLGIVRHPYTWLKRFVTIPATFGYRCSQNLGWCTIPPRIHSLTIAAFVIVNVVLCSINYHTFPGNLYWPEVPTQLCRYISDRTGVISFANFPLIWAFGTRNNVLMWVTGWGFGTFNSFHRWVARVSTLEAVVHSIGYTIMVLERGWPSFQAYFAVRWWLAGELATILMCMICIFSVYGLRRSFYEIFLFLHIVLSILVLVTMLFHVEIFNGEYDGYIWPCLFIWILDRILRLLRILSFNPRFWNTKATTTYNPDSNIVRLTVPYSTSLMNPQPGTYYYLYILNDLRVWENHPFTVAYATTEKEPSDSESPSLGTISPPHRVPSPPVEDSDPIELSSTEGTLLLPSSCPPSSLVFLIRPYDGFTSRLRDSAAFGSAWPRVLVEGPYGDSQPFHTFDSILFIVGGTGIAVPLSYLDRLLGDDSRTKSIHLIWAVREHAFLNEVVQTDFRNALENERVSLTAFVTKDEVDKPDQLSASPASLRVCSGRPNVPEEVELAASNSRHGSLAVVACGPAQMSDEARRAVVTMLGRGCGQVEYFEESFKW